MAEMLTGTDQEPTDEVRFTEAEIEVIFYASAGFSNKETAIQLGVSHRTVETHRYNLRKKCDLGSSNRALVALAIRIGVAPGQPGGWGGKLLPPRKRKIQPRACLPAPPAKTQVPRDPTRFAALSNEGRPHIPEGTVGEIGPEPTFRRGPPANTPASQLLAGVPDRRLRAPRNPED